LTLLYSCFAWTSEETMWLLRLLTLLCTNEIESRRSTIVWNNCLMAVGHEINSHSKIHGHRKQFKVNTKVQRLILYLCRYVFISGKNKPLSTAVLTSEVLTAASMKMAVFWVVAPCRLVKVYRRLRGTCRHQHKGYSSSRWWRQQVPLKRRWTFTRLHGATIQKTSLLF
jgi:hypothetical protein